MAIVPILTIKYCDSKPTDSNFTSTGSVSSMSKAFKIPSVVS